MKIYDIDLCLKWLLVFGLNVEAKLHIFKCVLVYLNGVCRKGEGGHPRTLANHTSWMLYVISTDRH